MRLSTRAFRTRALTLSIRGIAQRFSHILLIGTAATLMIVGQARPEAASRMRMAFVDMFAPFVALASSPVAEIRQIAGTVDDLLNMDTVLTQMRRDNAALLQWRDAALRLKAENDALRTLLNYKSEPQATSLTARVLADTEDSLSQNMIVLAGTIDGVRPDSAAITDRGLIGRLLEVGSHTARIMLLTDIDSRVPVWVEKNHDRAILTGSNDGAPTLMYLPADADVEPGDRIVTSGNGGIFPAGIPVGVVAAIKNGHPVVSLLADPAHTDYVRIVDYGGTITPPDDEADDNSEPTDQAITKNHPAKSLAASSSSEPSAAQAGVAPLPMARQATGKTGPSDDTDSADTGDDDR